ncbi:B-cell scaffold protein with ankyrin repeats-like isoform X1 [Myxocyprinus asiaticus]|uniref:B-cell scaffold protein with ankyrin repeats-like isoform X1 n=1 Tax=Myxocyprinus asiaticus TaxID=70543 RepID=UPI002223E344|nr:B-cell scaffold protein with ankyrin repeats-like isoform X1 [Myxocyprinus asiaticus]
MSNTSKDLLIIYESEAEQWASYLRFHLVGPIPQAGICCYDIAMVTSRQDDFLQLGGYKCKLLILSRGMLEGLCQLQRFFLARVLRPETRVVILLCGVESLDPLLELVPLRGEKCLQISSEQEPQEYCMAVAEIVNKGGQAAAVDGKSVQELKVEKKLSGGALASIHSLLVLPKRVPCENPGEIFILLQEVMASKDAEVEFSRNKQRVRVKPVNWNESTLSVTAPDFDAGDVGVTLYCKGVVKGKASLQFYTVMGDIAHFLEQAADPVKCMCQAFQVSSLEKLDQTLASCLMHKMPTGGFQGLQCDQFPAGESHSEDIPTLLHFAAQHGLRDLTSALLQCPGALQALKIPNSCGYTPIDLAHIHGHIQLYILLKESVGDNDGNTDTGVYELMGRTNNLQLADPDEQHQRDDEREDIDDENVYSPVGRDDEEYDTILTSSSAVVIANRPPAPTPRPECLPIPDNKTPFIAQVFQKKKSQGDAEILYSLPTRQARERESISSTYDTFMPSQAPGLDELIKLQEQVKTGSLSIDDALDRFNDWQRLQRGMDSIQQEKIQQLRASIVNNREDNESVYDKISIVHHTPTASENECRRASQQLETDFYSKPLKGHHSHFFKKADKQ